MEVHAHTHTPRKKWTHYFWEFLMLFLAVFCGFLAEYQLEHVIEHQREKQFIRSMIDDLRSDTASLSIAIEKSWTQIHGKDTFIILIDQEKWTPDEITRLYDLHWNYLGYTSEVLFSKRTITQLFNAGGLRMIRNKRASDSITLYALGIERMETKSAPQNLEYSRLVLNASASIFDNRFLHYVVDSGRRMLPNPTLLAFDKGEMKKFAFMLEQDKDYLGTYLSQLSRQKEFAAKLIALLKREYHTE